MSDEQHDCKFCLEPITNSLKAMKPCNCNAYVHNKCLDQWNQQRGEGDGAKCEICKSSYATNKVTTFDKKACCTDIFSVIYVIFAILAMIFAVPFVMLGLTLFEWSDPPDSGQIIGVTLGPYGFYGAMMMCYIFTNQEYIRKTNISCIGYLNTKPILKFATLLYYISLGVIVIQGLGIIIANPILGRPIAFTPRGETFGIIFGILTGVVIIIVLIYLSIVGIKRYATNNWIKEEDVIVDK